MHTYKPKQRTLNTTKSVLRKFLWMQKEIDPRGILVIQGVSKAEYVIEL